MEYKKKRLGSIEFNVETPEKHEFLQINFDYTLYQTWRIQFEISVSLCAIKLPFSKRYLGDTDDIIQKKKKFISLFFVVIMKKGRIPGKKRTSIPSKVHEIEIKEDIITGPKFGSKDLIHQFREEIYANFLT